MGKPHGEVGKRRREQVIEAAVAIIAEEGIQNLSLSAIEDRTAMSRGQLTYYFPAKEDILLAVFDHTIEVMMTRRAEDDPAHTGCPSRSRGGSGWSAFLTSFVSNPPEIPEFHALQYTFLSQVGHRDDFRDRLANLYEHWRSFAVADLADRCRRAAPGRAARLGADAGLVRPGRLARPGDAARRRPHGLRPRRDAAPRPESCSAATSANRPPVTPQVNHERT